MIVLDTNVVSALLSGPGDSPALDWLAQQDPHRLALTTITVAEVTYGIVGLPTGQRRDRLAEAWSRLETAWPGQVLPLGAAQARAAGQVMAVRRRLGRPITFADASIAGICLVHGARLATRNTRDFDGVGLPTVDPWAA